jgi:4-alpha-glucanotransferase
VVKKISLLLGVHAHQPAGNFEKVLDDAHVRCYRPYIETLYRYPEFKFAVHFSGWLLDYLLRTYPQDMKKLQEMVQRGQVEMFGGGDTEPVLAAIPERDRRSQLRALSDRLQGAFGARPTGAWLTERVWESAVCPSLADSGIRYVTVDDYHFLCAGKTPGELNGYYCTEEGGVRLDLFPISEALRYRIPFSTAAEAIGFLESLAAEQEGRGAIYFDDIEKFGIWPETYEWVYAKKWLEQFIEGVLRSPLIETTHYRDFHRSSQARGVVYLPTTSYIEMNEWSLPAALAHEWADLVAQEKAADRYERRKPFIRGGIWRNFLSRYSEANWMHKRMQALSQRLAALPGRKAKPRMTELLHLAQANDAYWHGLFGGLYMPHLRRAVWNAIIELEALLDRAARRNAVEGYDCDFDGCTEIFLSNGAVQAVVRDDGWGAIHELASYRLKHNFADTLARREEHYYRKIRHRGSGSEQHGGAGIASAHDRVTFRHPISAADLEADSRPRALFLERVVRDGNEIVPRYAVADGAGGKLVLRDQALALIKTYALSGEAVVADYAFEQGATLEIELNIAMPSCDGALGRYVVDGKVAGGFGQCYDWPAINELRLEDGVLNGTLLLRAAPALRVQGAPHHTVSQSEDGFEKVMQAVTLRLKTQGAVTRVQVSLTAA